MRRRGIHIGEEDFGSGRGGEDEVRRTRSRANTAPSPSSSSSPFISSFFSISSSSFSLPSSPRIST